VAKVFVNWLFIEIVVIPANEVDEAPNAIE